jgi:hypothetical protein
MQVVISLPAKPSSHLPKQIPNAVILPLPQKWKEILVGYSTNSFVGKRDMHCFFEPLKKMLKAEHSK